MHTKSINSGSNQLRWVILLLVIAVILPTVCLLWFMTAAVKNERLAVRQKLIDICYDDIAAFKSEFGSNLLASKSSDINRIIGLVDKENIPIDAVKGDADGLVVYDAEGELIYPVISEYQSSDFTEKVQEVLKLEQNGDFQKAIDEYQIIINTDDSAVFPACMGIIRCFEKLELHEKQEVHTETADFFRKILWSDDRSIRQKFTPSQVAMIRVKQVQWLDTHKDVFTSGGMFNALDLWDTPWESYPSEVTIWALEKILEIAQRYKETYKLEDSIEKAKKRIMGEKISLACAEFFNDDEIIENWPLEKWNILKTPQSYYAFRYEVNGQNVLLIKARENFQAIFASDVKGIVKDEVSVRLLDGTNTPICGGEETSSTPFITTDFNSHFPGWKLEFYFKNDSVFENAASKQAAIYTWTGVLVVLLILSSGGIAVQVIGRQIKLNRLKNDFIATVSHELKTPLSSMRVLVDTLLEGNYSDQQQATEYLQLISKENRRLSRLIDNFLSFSRMERNKQAFNVGKADPCEIARSAGQAVQTKFNQENCKFSVESNDGLSSIMADKDAMVTVLVNLLDNAYKYSYDDKQIELRVFEVDGSICFSVKDDGIGMTRGQIKKVFDRFYQVDSTLARRAEGTGLGLSIVKFIVDAHKGKIEAESKPGKGSEFKVMIPVYKG